MKSAQTFGEPAVRHAGRSRRRSPSSPTKCCRTKPKRRGPGSACAGACRHERDHGPASAAGPPARPSRRRRPPARRRRRRGRRPTARRPRRCRRAGPRRCGSPASSASIRRPSPTPRPERLQAEVERLIAEIADEQRIQLNGREQRQLAGELVNDMLGLGPLEPLLDDDSITDIMVNGPDRVFVERRGKLVLSAVALPRHRRMSPTSPSASPPRSAGASTKAARWWMRGWRTARASTSSSRRWRWTAPASRSASSPASRIDFDTLVGNGSASPQIARVLEIAARRAAQRDHLRRHRLGQDHAAERHVAA